MSKILLEKTIRFKFEFIHAKKYIHLQNTLDKLKEELKHLEASGVKYISSEDDYHRFEINTSDPSIINLLRKKYYFEEVNNETH